MTKKTHTLAVKVGTYTKNGEEKNKYLYIGSILEGEYGPFILMDKTFNPAGVNHEGDCIKISMFAESKDKADRPGKRFDDIDVDEIPF